jgi:hypothetical protein
MSLSGHEQYLVNRVKIRAAGQPTQCVHRVTSSGGSTALRIGSSAGDIPQRVRMVESAGLRRRNVSAAVSLSGVHSMTSIARALVALDVRSGEERWHFQTVHRDLWDFDRPVGPALVDVHTSHGIVPVLVQNTKLGDLFMLDRRTGQPIAAVEEQSVPTEPAPGEHVSRTQPRSVGMPTLHRCGSPKRMRGGNSARPAVVSHSVPPEQI